MNHSSSQQLTMGVHIHYQQDNPSICYKKELENQNKHVKKLLTDRQHVCFELHNINHKNKQLERLLEVRQRHFKEQYEKNQQIKTEKILKNSELESELMVARHKLQTKDLNYKLEIDRLSDEIVAEKAKTQQIIMVSSQNDIQQEVMKLKGQLTLAEELNLKLINKKTVWKGQCTSLEEENKRLKQKMKQIIEDERLLFEKQNVLEEEFSHLEEKDKLQDKKDAESELKPENTQLVQLKPKQQQQQQQQPQQQKKKKKKKKKTMSELWYWIYKTSSLYLDMILDSFGMAGYSAGTAT
ncbi:involucrin-like [Gouania willdenowi]|uniref:involucrin-like n=1 Tax=Gouania willdenowi TaxID=441366 RepID=UPI001055BEC0|nr:involucrin-like [Gouania willdenowi]